MIKPTIGRVVWFYPHGSLKLTNSTQGMLPALICCVHSDKLINIGGFDANGAPFASTSVQLLQDDDKPVGGSYCAWMPYQVGQAKKHEPESEAALEAARIQASANANARI